LIFHYRNLKHFDFVAPVKCCVMLITLHIVYPMFLCEKIGTWNNFSKDTNGKYWVLHLARLPGSCIGILLDVFRVPARFSRTGKAACFMGD